MKRHANWVVFLVAVVLYAAFAARPSWHAVESGGHGRDFATFYYAYEAAQQGLDPYDSEVLSTLAREDGTRKSVHPFFYPPPFLFGMAWTGPLTLAQSYQAWWWMNQVLVVAVGALFWGWLRAPLWLLGVILLTFTPIPDNCKMGQVNLAVLVFALSGLWWTRGALVSVAGMSKMSPALYLVSWAAQRRWRAFVEAAVGAVALTALALVIVPFETQMSFYTEVLPGFSSGDYNGLSVKITLPANHSIPNLFNQLWPGESQRTLSPGARRASSASSLVLLGLLGLLSRCRRDPLGQALLFGAMTVLLVITPVYTYEHHLVFALLPAVALAVSVLRGRLPRWSIALAGPAYALVAWPLWLLRDAQEALPDLAWWIQESKFLGLVGLGLLCVWGVLRSPVVASD